MRHVPVLLNEAVDGLMVKPGGKYIDATYGAGGHTAEIEKRGGKVLAIDVDPEANAPVKGNFRDIERLAKEHGFDSVDGVLFDLGVSSMQLDTPERGFSYRFFGPLDLRLDQTKGQSARDIINTYSEGELYEIFARLGEEEHARAIARAIVRTRGIEPFSTTGTLVKVITESIPQNEKPQPVLSRIFQALRIEVNDELGALKEGLIGAWGILDTGGRLVVISFHSLEDRIVKRYMRQTEGNVITKQPIRPRSAEIDRNPRAKSAKLRIVEKTVTV